MPAARERAAAFKGGLAAFLSVLGGIALAIGVVSLLGVEGRSGRDPMPLLALSAASLLVTGFFYGMLWHRNAASCALGLAVYMGLLALVIALLGGAGTDWGMVLVLATLPPWLLGFAGGHWLRPRLT
jgi:hypothetical protein